jgi:hypothetical protein
MVDVVVDQKPMEKQPYDPNDIPDAVRKRAAAVDALYSNGQPAETPESIPQAPPEPVLSSPTPTPAVASAEPADENDLSWKHRFLAMQGRHTATTKTIGEMQEQMNQLANELMHVQQQPQRQPKAPSRTPQNYLTEQDVENYGPELIQVTQRAALQAVAPQLAEVEQQNAELRRQMAREARRRLDQAVELSVPTYKEIDRNPRWHRWLLGVDVLSGRVRQQLLNEAISAASAPRVISFFRGFLNEEAATGHIEPAPSSQQPAAPREAAIPLASLAAPGRARPATGGETQFPPDKPLYTRAQIAQLYRQHQKGAYVGREAEWQRQDADIIAAGREGRIR